MVAGSPALQMFVGINFLHFAILIFVVSAVLLVVVSLATAPEPRAKLTNLTFATLEGKSTPRPRPAPPRRFACRLRPRSHSRCS